MVCPSPVGLHCSNDGPGDHCFDIPGRTSSVGESEKAITKWTPGALRPGKAACGTGLSATPQFSGLWANRELTPTASCKQRAAQVHPRGRQTCFARRQLSE